MEKTWEKQSSCFHWFPGGYENLLELGCVLRYSAVLEIKYTDSLNTRERKTVLVVLVSLQSLVYCGYENTSIKECSKNMHKLNYLISFSFINVIDILLVLPKLSDFALY